MKKNLLLEASAKNGWECQWKPEANIIYRLSGTTQDGISWQMECGGSRGYTIWNTDSVHLDKVKDQTIGFSQHKPSSPYSLSNLIGKFFIKPALQKAIRDAMKEGADDGDKPPTEYYLDVQTPILKENHYNLYVYELEKTAVRRIFDVEVEQAIVNWFIGPGRNRFNEKVLDRVFIDEDVRVRIRSHLNEVPAVEQFVALGLTVARQVREAQRR